MRKIESQMNAAVRGQRNWAGSNTAVETLDNGLESRVTLHGNHIATYFHADRKLQIFDGGWQSNTTKSRLNALCFELATGFGVFQKNWEWFVNDRITGVTKDFEDGMLIG